MTVFVDEATLCARGCTGHDDVPYRATHGRYCARCWGRLDTALAQSGELVHHLLGNALTTPGAGGERVDSSRDAPLPFNQAAFDDANELYSLLVYWTAVWAEHLQTGAHTAAGWRSQSGKVVGLPAGTTPDDGAARAEGLARWLRNRLDPILTTTHTDDIDAFNDAISDVWRMNARWPRIERPAYSAMPCPRDDCKRRLAVYPPAFPGDARRIVCQGGHWYPEEEYEHLILVFEQDQKERKRVEKTAARLAKKYGIGA